VHCTHGQDRTGLIIGLYRLNEGWTKDAAYKEMLVHHFHSSLHGLHEYWENTP
jgi:protein tyrosine/serine phosphatase